jgi:hypothetical protein
MNAKFLTYLISPLALVVIGVTSAQTKITNQSKLTINGIGSIRVGMTLKEANRAEVGINLDVPGDDYNNIDKAVSCYYAEPQGEPKGLSFMISNGRIARVEVRKGAITTLSGAKIGDTEARIKALYPGQIKVTPHKYTRGGHYLTYVPKDKSDRSYRVVFETDGKRVTTFRAGKLPEVEYVEGCS